MEEGWGDGAVSPGRPESGILGMRGPRFQAHVLHRGAMVFSTLGELRDAPAVPYAKFPLEKGVRQTQAGSVLQLVLIMPSKPLPGPSLPGIWEQS